MNGLRRLYPGGSPNDAAKDAEAKDSQCWRSRSGDHEVSWISRETGLPWIGDGCCLQIWYDSHARDGGFEGREINVGNRGGHPMGV